MSAEQVEYAADSNTEIEMEFRRLFVDAQRRIFGYILTLLPKRDDAEEVFQQACVIILSKSRQFKPGTNFVHWACQIAKYEVFNYRRHQLKEKKQFFFSDAILEKIAARRLERGDLLENELDAMHECVKHLAPKDRRLIKILYSRRITVKALALKLGCKVNTVYKRIQRTRQNLRDCIEKALARNNRTTSPSALLNKEDRP